MRPFRSVLPLAISQRIEPRIDYGSQEDALKLTTFEYESTVPPVTNINDNLSHGSHMAAIEPYGLTQYVIEQSYDQGYESNRSLLSLNKQVKISDRSDRARHSYRNQSFTTQINKQKHDLLRQKARQKSTSPEVMGDLTSRHYFINERANSMTALDACNKQ